LSARAWSNVTNIVIKRDEPSLKAMRIYADFFGQNRSHPQSARYIREYEEELQARGLPLDWQPDDAPPQLSDAETESGKLQEWNHKAAAHRDACRWLHPIGYASSRRIRLCECVEDREGATARQYKKENREDFDNSARSASRRRWTLCAKLPLPFPYNEVTDERPPAGAAKHRVPGYNDEN
jgi:hypothetical protein